MRGLVLFLVLALTAPALAQDADPFAGTVRWTAEAQSDQALKPGSRLKLTLHGAIQKGWHVYGLKQLPGGPTPLRISLPDDGIARQNGAPVESRPATIHDPGFDLQTQFHTDAVTVTVPARLAAGAPTGARQIAVDVRYQTCSARICQPPRTAHLTAPIAIAAEIEGE